jgi:hypothetical protein
MIFFMHVKRLISKGCAVFVAGSLMIAVSDPRHLGEEPHTHFDRYPYPSYLHPTAYTAVGTIR